ncbi:MAG TPA: SAM-dependent methyltransferase [Caldimonas sp.]|jgi:SAM-dependent methyltransferase
MVDPTPVPEPAAAALPERVHTFVEAARAACDTGALETLVLAKPCSAGDGPKAIRIRRIALKGRPALSFVAAHATRDVTRNLAVDDGLAAVAGYLDPASAASFAHATLRTRAEDLELLVSKKGRATLRRHVRTAAATVLPDTGDAPPTHDRERTRRLPLDLPWLVELGLTDASHRLVPSMARKWRQIDKFLEVLDHALDALPAAAGASGAPRALRVADYGCGKGYLTFAVHEHLRRRLGVVPQVTGVELRAELVDFCNGVAARSGCAGLAFVEGDLRSVAPAEIDVMIALHACDTATDHAIDLGVRAGAAILVCAPCCHKELRPQMARPRLLSGLLRHGVHLGQEAEMVTDSMRALLLETCGYDARVFEFVSLEHTSKNKMILGRRRQSGSGNADRARAEIDDLKSFYGIRSQCLETLLAGATAERRAGAAQACQTP